MSITTGFDVYHDGNNEIHYKSALCPPSVLLDNESYCKCSYELAKQTKSNFLSNSSFIC